MIRYRSRMRIDHEGAVFPYRQLASLLRADIKAGRYPPGSRIPSVRELARDTRLGPMTVQRAIKTLVAEGVVYTVPGRGTFVTGGVTSDEGPPVIDPQSSGGPA